jgi:hypothetical protein
MHFKMCVFITTLLFTMQAAIAAEDENSIKITPSGFAYYQIGQIESYTPDDGSLPDKMFDQHFNGRLTLSAVINQKLRIVVGAEGELGYTGVKDLATKMIFLLKEAQGIYSFGDPENSPLQITAGYFPFKYNPESSTLGEYLFRSGAYPGYVITDFDFAKARLMGFNVSSTLFENLHLNALFTSEYKEPPFFDYSLTFLAGYKLPNKILDFGAGIDFNRLIPIDPSKTTDHDYPALDNQGNQVFENGDSVFYTKIGTKIMGRLTFDPKPFLPFADLLDSSDFKLYGEFAILGLKNYGAYYPDISQRIPVMVGFNVPCFRTIDLVSLEFEYYGQNPAYIANTPASASQAYPDHYSGSVRSYFKWSIYGVKTLTKGIAVKGLIGRDHFRGTDPVGNYDPADRMNGPYDWHYNLRLMYSF